MNSSNKKAQILLAMPLFRLDKNNHEMQLKILKKPLRNTTASFVTLQSRMNVSIIHQMFKSILTNLFLCNDVFTYAMVILASPALSKDRTMRRSVSENSLQGSVSVKKNHIIEMGGFLLDDQELLIK